MKVGKGNRNEGAACVFCVVHKLLGKKGKQLAEWMFVLECCTWLVGGLKTLMMNLKCMCLTGLKWRTLMHCVFYY